MSARPPVADQGWLPAGLGGYRHGPPIRSVKWAPDGSHRTTTYGLDWWITRQRHDADGRLTLTRHTHRGRLCDSADGQSAITLHGTNGQEVRLHYRDGIPTDPSPAIPAIHTRDSQGRIVAGIHYLNGHPAPSTSMGRGARQALLRGVGEPDREQCVDR